MKRSNSDPDIDNFPGKRYKLPERLNTSAIPISTPPGNLPGGSGLNNVTEADIELRRIIDNFVNIYEQLGKCNGPNVKPNYSYTELAYLAMLRSPNFCLPITEIYRYIQSRFAFFKNSTRKHWKNAVRHSLAKTLCFTKITVGRGKSSSENLSRSTYLWCIIPNSITSFARGDYRPSSDKESGSNSLRWGYYRTNASQFWDQIGNFLATKMAAFKNALDTSSDPGHMFESQVCQLPEPLPRSQEASLLTPVINKIPKSEERGGDSFVPPAAFVASPPLYGQSANNQTHYTQYVKQEAFSQPYIKREPFREITSTPLQSRAQVLKPPKTQIVSPDSNYLSPTEINRLTPATPAHRVHNSAMQRVHNSATPAQRGHNSATPAQRLHNYHHDSGIHSPDSSLEERGLLSSCRQQRYTVATPPLNLALDEYTPASNDLIDFDISPFEIPELSDFSHIVSPQLDSPSSRSVCLSPYTDIPFQNSDISINDSGYVVNYSIDLPRSYTESPCRFTNRVNPFTSTSLQQPAFKNFMTEENSIFTTVTDSGKTENHFLRNSDPMFGHCNGGYSSWKL